MPAIHQAANDRAERRRRQVSSSNARLRDRRENATRRALSPFFSDLRKTIMGRVRKIGTVGFTVEEIFTPPEIRDRLNSIMQPQWNRTVWTGIDFEKQWVESAEVQQSILRARAVFQEIDLNNPQPPPSIKVEMSDALQRSVRSHLRERTEGLWGDVATTTHNRLRRAIQKGLKEGDSFDDMERRINRELRSLSKHSSRRIARTETTRSMNFGQQARRDELGIADKEWVSRIDVRTRGADPADAFNHLFADGQTVQNRQLFVVSGENLLHPGDSSHGASGGNVIHCRCTAVSATQSGTSRPTTPTERSPFDQAKPRHITYSGEENNLARRVWKEIGDGIETEEHARRVGRQVREDILERTAEQERLVKRLKEEHREAVAKKDLFVLDNRDIDLNKSETYRDLRRKADNAEVRFELEKSKLDRERADLALGNVKKVRDLGGVELEYRGNKSLRKPLQKSENNIPKDWLRDSKEAGKIEVRKRARGYYSDAEDAIAIGREDFEDTATHELIHRMEYKARPATGKAPLVRLEKEFKMRRAAEAGEERPSLITRTRDGKTEWGFEDEFTEHYMGRVYPGDSAHEILSMGWEGIVHGKYDIWSDPDYVDFVLGMISGV